MTKYGLNLAFASRPRPLCYVAPDLEEETQETELWTDGQVITIGNERLAHSSLPRLSVLQVAFRSLEVFISCLVWDLRH